MSIYSTAKNYARKYAKKGTKAVGKRYGVSYGRRGLRVGKGSIDKVFKDVQMIKSRLNVEKKFVQGDISNGLVAQANGNAPGYYTSQVTPLVPQGTGENQRVGGSIKLTGFHMQFQFQGQDDCYQGRSLKIHLIRSTDSAVTNVVNDLFDVNPLTGFVDYYSNRNYTNNPKAHQILKTAYCKIPQKQVLSNTISGYNAQKHKTMGMKMQQLCRFEGLATLPKDTFYWIVIFCDGGNYGGTNSTNSGVMTPEDNTGLNLQEYFRWWYVDN